MTGIAGELAKGDSVGANGGGDELDFECPRSHSRRSSRELTKIGKII